MSDVLHAIADIGKWGMWIGNSSAMIYQYDRHAHAITGLSLKRVIIDSSMQTTFGASMHLYNLRAMHTDNIITYLWTMPLDEQL
jgi:hypothetical protein